MSSVSSATNQPRWLIVSPWDTGRFKGEERTWIASPDGISSEVGQSFPGVHREELRNFQAIVGSDEVARRTLTLSEELGERDLKRVVLHDKKKAGSISGGLERDEKGREGRKVELTGEMARNRLGAVN